eukprot:243028-Hanusia_phi.AAC.1
MAKSVQEDRVRSLLSPLNAQTTPGATLLLLAQHEIVFLPAQFSFSILSRLVSSRLVSSRLVSSRL